MAVKFVPKRYSLGEIEALKKNPNVLEVQENRLLLTIEFRQQVYEAWIRRPERSTVRRMLEANGFDTQRLGLNFTKSVESPPRTNTIHVFQYLMVVWLHIHDSKCIVRIYGIAAKCVICDVDIHPDVDYTCHDDPSLYVASLVTLGSHLKYDRQIHALQVLRSFHIVLRC